MIFKKNFTIELDVVPKNDEDIAKLEEQIRTLQNNLAIAEYGIFDYSHVDGDPEVENKANFVPTSMLLKRFNDTNIDKLKSLIEI